MKKQIAALLLSCLLLTAAIPGAAATEWDETEETVEETVEETLREPGSCGEDLTWSFSGNTLTITGTGEMDPYPDGDAPWLIHKDNITTLIFSGGVTSVGDGAFTDYDALQTVDFGSAMHTIGVQAFKSCDGLTSVTLPATFRRFGKECFMSCANLTQIVCRGGMPSFNGNCVWDVYATIYYPANNAWPLEHILQLTEAFHNRIEFRAGEGGEGLTEEETVAQTWPAETEAATEAVQTQPPETEPEVTQAQTVPTAAVTDPAQTVAETVQETVPETTRQTMPAFLEQTETDPEGEEEAQKKGLPGGVSGIVVCGALFAAVISFLLIGALIFRRRRY